MHTYMHVHACSLDMLDKFEVPPIPEGYPMVIAVNALLDTVRSVALIISEQDNHAPSKGMERMLPPPLSSVQGDGVEGVILRSSWSGVLAALALLLDAWYVCTWVTLCIAYCM